MRKDMCSPLLSWCEVFLQGCSQVLRCEEVTNNPELHNDVIAAWLPRTSMLRWGR